ncbi:hypothetical protein BVI2075_180124 [Burkholderia vietnamiensis]|nr:hypothetical protein BVI2075_180124 [Burkholderia vietnamiensis]
MRAARGSLAAGERVARCDKFASALVHLPRLLPRPARRAVRQCPTPVITTMANTSALSTAASAATPAAPLTSCHARSMRFICLLRSVRPGAAWPRSLGRVPPSAVIAAAVSGHPARVVRAEPEGCRGVDRARTAEGGLGAVREPCIDRFVDMDFPARPSQHADAETERSGGR